jgi:hypothetical protein
MTGACGQHSHGTDLEARARVSTKRLFFPHGNVDPAWTSNSAPFAFESSAQRHLVYLIQRSSLILIGIRGESLSLALLAL